MIDELEQVRRARPQGGPASADARAGARRALDAAMAPRPRSPRALPRLRLPLLPLASATALLVVIAVVAVFLALPGHKAGPTSPRGGSEVVFRAQPAAQSHGVSPAVVARAASTLGQLLPFVAGGRGGISWASSGDEIIVHVGGGSQISQLLSLADMTGRLAFYDWEANALTPNGRTVVSQLRRGARSALTISQGVSAPGTPGAGSLSLYSAVRLAARQPTRASADNSRPGPEYFLFGRPNTGACGPAQADRAFRLGLAAHCYVAGPTATAEQALASLPAGVSPAEVQMFVVRQGTLVLEAVPGDFAHRPSLADPAAQFFVLRDHAAVVGTQIVNPQPGKDQSGAPDIRFGFTPDGAAAFQGATAAAAHRGAELSTLGQTLDQHFAVALGDQLLTVPSIDFRTYPDGILGDGADLTGGFTTNSVRQAVMEVRLGSLPIVLRLISISTGSG